ncbi:MAG: T9SS type A sorting domain-containing protein [Bacteroidetes bacterium]|nr:T9SS type A sorting domain-containing protein [Bacteroidota bacterium]
MKTWLRLGLTLFVFTLVYSDMVSAQFFNTGKIGVGLSNAGRIRIFKEDDETRMTDRISILVAGKQNEVFDYWNDADSVTGSGGSYSVENPLKSDFEVGALIDNNYNAHQDPPSDVFPPNLQADIRVYGWTGYPFVIVKVAVKNMETDTLDARFGLEIIPQIDGNYGFETTKYFAEQKVASIFSGDASYKIGFKLLSQSLTTLKTIDWFDGYNGSDADLYGWMTTGTLESEFTSPSADGTVTFLGTDATAVEPAAAADYYFAVAIGATDGDLLSGMTRAQDAYNSLFAEKQPPFFNTGKIGVGLSNAGRLRIFKEDDETRMADRISVLVAGNPNEVFDYWNDADSLAGAGGAFAVSEPAYSDYEAIVAIDNNYNAHQDPPTAVYPPNVVAEIHVLGWENQNWVLVRVDVTNTEEATAPTRFGLEVLPQIDGNYGFETTKLLADAKVASIFSGDASYKLGFKFLSHDMTTLKTIDWVDGYNGSDADLFGWMTTGSLEAEYTTPSSDGTVTFMSANRYNLDAGATESYYYAVAIGADEAALLNGIKDAETKYTGTFTSVTPVAQTPSGFTLYPNYPNPFNPSTVIRFNLPSAGFTTVKVYNTLGQQVAELVNSTLTAGDHRVEFAAGNLAAGTYLYTVTSGSSRVSGKMVLLK